MKRLHIHVHVDDLAASVAVYSKLFAAEPARVEVDYAKWMLDDPRVNFAISTRDAAQLGELAKRAEASDMVLADRYRNQTHESLYPACKNWKVLIGSFPARRANAYCRP